MIACRVGLLTRTLSRLSLQRSAPFSSSSATQSKFSGYFSDEAEGGSAVYRHALKFQRPTTIRWQPELRNCVSLIGLVYSPLKIIVIKTGCVAYTWLQVVHSPYSNGGFRIQLDMWGDMAELCEKILKPNDFIYVSGSLGSYTKTDERGNLRLRYKVNVKDLNYVQRHGQGVTCQKPEESKSGEGEADIDKHVSQEYLWQLYFFNPYEWWDNRKNKLWPGSPDFKHKDTGEALWLKPNDPPWIKKQLQLLDSKMAEQRLRSHVGSRSLVAMWTYDE